MIDNDKLEKVKEDEWLYEGCWKIYKICDWRYNVLGDDDMLVASGKTLEEAIEALERKKARASDPWYGGVYA